MKVGILKPDHIGDLILSSPAIRAIAAQEKDAVLFVAPKNRQLAQFLFPDIEIREIEMAHLSKGGRSESIPDLREFEMVALLRGDVVLNEIWANLRTRGYVLPVDSHDIHQSLIDFSVAAYFCGDYDIDAGFFSDRAERIATKACRNPRRIGLSIGSGFHANAWPTQRWVETGNALLPVTDAIVLLCGPAERAKAALIADRLGRPKSLSIVEGGADVSAFVSAVDDLDVVIASDGGTAHLCSLVTPIISIFGPSPFRRYAPFGKHNRLLTRKLSCSPCCQYATNLVNGCLTTECITEITTGHIERALSLPLNENAQAASFGCRDGVYLYRGVSHLNRDAHVDRFFRATLTSWAQAPGALTARISTPRVLAAMQDARIGLVSAVDRLKRSDDRDPRWIGATMARLARLRELNEDVAAYLKMREPQDVGFALDSHLPPGS